MVALRKNEPRPSRTAKVMTKKAEQHFYEAVVEKPKPPTKYLKDMFRLYGKRTSASGEHQS